MQDGIIELDSEQAKAWGFTSDKFFTGSYLWKDNNTIIVSFIWSKYQGKGNFKRLIENILKDNFTIQIPTPSDRMRFLAKKWGGKDKMERDPELGPVEVIEIECSPIRCAG